MNSNKPIQIFSAGTHIASNGTEITFSDADVAASAAAYNPALSEAPLVKGHPKTDDPAFGWVQSVEKRGAAMFGVPRQVDAQFAEDVKAGRWKKRSASFYSPTHPQNPVPGVYYLKHVGFLGAVPPAVKGMLDPEFSDGEEGLLTFSEDLTAKDFADWEDTINARLWRSLRDWFIGKHGKEEADRTLSDWDIQTLADKAAQPDESVARNFSEVSPSPKGDEMSQEDKDRLATLEAENAKLKADQAAFAEAEANRKKKATHDDHLAFAEGLVKAGNLLPAHKDLTVAALDHLAAPDTALEFGEGDDKKPLVESFKAFLSAQPKQVEFGEIAPGSGGIRAELSPEEIAAKAVEFQEAEAKAGRTISATAAVNHITQGSK